MSTSGRLQGAIIATVVGMWAAVSPVPVALAGDANAETCANEASLGFRGYMPDCRAYEMVTPVYKGGSEVLLLEAVSSDGLHVIGTSYGGFAGTENNEQSNLPVGAGIYELSRAPMGWQAEPLEPAAYQHSGYLAASADLSATLWEQAEQASPGVELFTAGKRQKLALRVHEAGAAPRFEPIGPEDSPTEATNVEDFRFRGVSSDLSRVVYGIAPGTGATWPGDETKGGRSLYEYVGLHNSEPLLVGVYNEGRLKGSPHVNEGAQLISKCGTELGAFGTESKYNSISADGTTVFFTASPCSGEPPVGELYARVHEERTVAISEPKRPISGGQGTGPRPQECDATCEAAAPREAFFQGASEDGSKVFFTTAQPLLNGDEGGEGTGDDLYEAELEGGRLTRLIQVSHDPNGSEAAGVQGVARISATGRRVYFVATGALAGANGAGKAPVTGADNLYVYDTTTGTLSFVASLAAGDEADWAMSDSHRPFETTADGRFAVFASSAHLTADDTSAVAQLFEYDAASEGLRRVSIGQQSQSGYLCPTTQTLEAGYGCNGNTAVASEVPAMATPDYSASYRPTETSSTLSLAEDGRVFFMSRDELTPPIEGEPQDSALRGSKNIYEYSHGNVYLIAPGEDPQLEYGAFQESFLEHDRLVSVDPQGTDVFFGAVGQLLPQDTDTQADLYDARVGGGAPALPTSEGCRGQSCRPASGQAPALVSPPSAALPGEAEPTIAPAPPTKAKPSRRAQRLASALRACHAKARRARRRCEAKARRRYGRRRA